VCPVKEDERTKKIQKDDQDVTRRTGIKDERRWSGRVFRKRLRGRKKG